MLTTSFEVACLRRRLRRQRAVTVMTVLVVVVCVLAAAADIFGGIVPGRLVFLGWAAGVGVLAAGWRVSARAAEDWRLLSEVQGPGRG